MNTFHDIGEERELFRQITRDVPSRPRLDVRSPALHAVLHRVLFVLLASALGVGVAVALGSSTLVSGG